MIRASYIDDNRFWIGDAEYGYHIATVEFGCEMASREKLSDKVMQELADDISKLICRVIERERQFKKA